MPLHKPGPEWTKIASAGDCVSLTNSGPVSVLISTAKEGRSGRELVAGGSHYHVATSTDLFVRSDQLRAEIVTTIQPGMPTEL